MRKSIFFLILFLTFALAGTVHSGAYEDGVEATERGDYEEALRLWRPLAEQGIPKAQFNLAVLYQNGEGVLQSDSAAIDWYYKAGMKFIEVGNREGALTAYDRIKWINAGHFLGRKLQKALYP